MMKLIFLLILIHKVIFQSILPLPIKAWSKCAPYK